MKIHLSYGRYFFYQGFQTGSFAFFLKKFLNFSKFKTFLQQELILDNKR